MFVLGLVAIHQPVKHVEISHSLGLWALLPNPSTHPTCRVIIRRAAVQPSESFQATGKQKTRRFVAALLGCGQKNSGDGFLQSIWQTWNFMICCFFVGVMFALLKLSGLKVYRSLHHKIFSVLFCWSLSDPKFHGMSFCQGKWSTVFFQWEFVSKKHEMPNYTTSHIHTFFCSGTNYGDLGMCSSTFCHELLRWPFPRHRKKHLLFGTLWLDPKIIYPKKHRSPQSFLRLWITSAFFEITHGVSSGPSEPKTTTKISTNGRSWPPNQLGVIVVAMRSIRKAFPWEDGELANLRAGDLFVMVGRLRSVMNVWPF